jgi:hypothetical protein
MEAEKLERGEHFCLQRGCRFMGVDWQGQGVFGVSPSLWLR